LAFSLAVNLTAEQGLGLSRALSALFFVLSLIFVWRSFYGMRIGSERA
jgi:K(+)-stimulated pyrophosphate-energized sodium pump